MDNRFLGAAITAVVVALFAIPLIGPRLGTDAPAPTSSAPVAMADRLAAAARIDGARVIAADSEPGNWLAHGRTYSEQRYSPLTDINKDTVSTLGVAWEFETGTVRGLEASPIVVDGVMFVSGPWSLVWALDAKTGEELWSFDPEVPGERGRFACCDVVNRGVAVWDGHVYVGALDGRLIALDAKTGKPVWQTQTFIDSSKPYTITGAPRIVNGKVLIGNGGAELGVRGYVSAYDAKSGELVWRFFTVPGDPSKPIENPELGAAMATWSNEGATYNWWEIGGGGTVWDSMSYDPALNTLYVGVGNGSPWSRYVRSPGGGDNLYVSSILALNPDTGRMKWFYQTTPGDTWDFTSTQHMILADIEIDGVVRHVLMQAPKNGFFYVIDRETGKLISAKNYTLITWATGIDLATGRPIENADNSYENAPSAVIPAQVGGHNWQPMAFNPQTGLVYIPSIDSAALFIRDNPIAYRPGLWNTGIDFAAVTKALMAAVAAGEPPPPARGFIRAWDPVKQEERWSVPMTGAWNGGLMTTAGGLVFGGGGDGIFAAYDATTGEQVWKLDLKTGILAPPVTYTVDGEQYIALAAGWGGALGLANLKDPNMAAVKYGNAGRIFAFRLGGRQSVEPIAIARTEIEAPPAVTASAEMIEAGFTEYHRTCVVCHGFFAESAGVIPDLRMSAKEVFDRYQQIVIGGELKAGGMAAFGDQLSAADVEAVKAYVLTQAKALYDSQQAGTVPVTPPEPAPTTP